jgi:hypothetical protein
LQNHSINNHKPVVLEPVPVLSIENNDAKALNICMQQDGSPVQTNHCVPWSLEWLPKSKGAATIESASKILIEDEQLNEFIIEKHDPLQMTKKDPKAHSKKLKHSAGLKRVARMSSGDRR